jgi:radical SAM superfamily enzyme YgiQ (UPF0313 family)
MYGKCKPFTPEDWPDVVIDAFQILSDHHWVPAATLIIGLPKEDDMDIDLTVQLVERLQEFKSLIVPLFFVAEGALANETESFVLEHMNRFHGELFVKCWKHNLKWIPALLKEYSNMCMKNDLKRYALRIVASRGIKYASRLFVRCEDEYDYDLAKMIKDIRKGKICAVPQPLRIIHQFQRIARTS